MTLHNIALTEDILDGDTKFRQGVKGGHGNNCKFVRYYISLLKI
jgi:hypothetical protein